MNTYLAAFRSGLSSLLEYRMDYFSNSFLSLIVLIGVQYFLWDSVFAGRDNLVIGQYTSDSVFLYVIFAAVYGVIIRSGRIEKNVSEEIRKGDLNKYLSSRRDYFNFDHHSIHSILHSITHFLGRNSLVIFTCMHGDDHQVFHFDGDFIFGFLV